MSLATDILDRLSGVSIVKAELLQTAERMDRLSDLVIDRLAMLAMAIK